MKKQPRALYLLNFISMWECFSYYGMRVLLVLFMIHELQFSESQAFGLYALYITLVELAGLAGGVIADQYLGLKRAIFFGAFTIVLGHLALSIPGFSPAFYLGLSLIVVGTGLFRPNTAALLGEFYDQEEERNAGYTLYYAGINLGGFLATAICGAAGEIFGWHAGFSLAAFGMLLGSIALWIFQRMLEGKGGKFDFSIRQKATSALAIVVVSSVLAFLLNYHVESTPFIPILIAICLYLVWKKVKKLEQRQKSGIIKLCLYIGFLIVFFLCEEQLGSSLIVFAERHTDRQTFLGLMPAASLITFNPLTILILGPLLTRPMQKLQLSVMTKIAISFICLGAGFSTLFVSCLMTNAEEMTSVGFAIFSVILIALGEIFMGPTLYAFASEVGSKSYQGLTMGLVTLGYALANLLSGPLSQIMAEEASLERFSHTFAMLGLCLLSLSLLIILITHKKRIEAL